MSTVPYLDAEQARRVYDRIGRLQDTQRFYENRAVDLLVAGGHFADAHAVVEVGCGTGALAARLLGRELPAARELVGVDLSPRMAALARGRVAPFGARARIELADAAERIPVEDGWADRLVSAYVLDLLPPERARAVLAEAARALAPGGLLCLASLTTGRGAAARLLAAAVVAALGRCGPSSSAAAGPPTCCRCSPARSGTSSRRRW